MDEENLVRGPFPEHLGVLLLHSLVLLLFLGLLSWSKLLGRGGLLLRGGFCGCYGLKY